MDYKEKYEKALEGVQEILSSGQDSIKMTGLQLRLQGIFPELKKIENDTMIEVVKNIIAMTDKGILDEILNIYGKSKDDIISWLEKQGKKSQNQIANNVDKIEPKFKVGDIISNGKIVYRVYGIIKNGLGQNYYSLVDVDSEKKGTLYLTMYDSKGETYHMGETRWLCAQVDAKFEKQGEQKPLSITDEWIEDYWNHKKVNNPYSYDKGDEIQFDHQGFVRFCKKYCTKPTDKEDLTFKVGDWIIRSAEGFKHDIYLVTDVKDYYVCEDLNGERVTFTFNDVHKHFTLWTVHDAKEGDILVCVSRKYGQEIGIVKKYVGKYGGCDKCFSTYCHINWEGRFTVGDYMGSKDIHPAFKEQRDILFQKMEKAGYEWDSDNKIVKQISLGRN